MKNLKKFFAVMLSALIVFCSVVPVSAAENKKTYSKYCHSVGNPDIGLKSYIDFVIPILLENPNFTFDNYYIYFFMYNNCYSFSVIDTSFLREYGDLKVSYNPVSREFHGIHIPSTCINPLSSTNETYVQLSNLISSRDFDHGGINGVTTMLYTDNFINLYFTSYVDSSFIRPDGAISDYFVFHSSFLNDSDSDFDFPDSVPFPMDVKGFSEFYAVSANGYLSKLNNALASNFSTSNIIDFLTYFSNCGGSPDSLYNSRGILSDLLGHSLPEDSPKSYCSMVFDIVRQHYSDYLKMKSLFLPDVKPNVLEDDSLITDQEDDPVDVSLLREIVRLLSLIYNRVNSGFSTVDSDFYSLGDKVNTVIYSISNIDHSVDNDYSSIIDAINKVNVGSPDISVDVTVTDQRQKEIDDFFSDWNTRYSDSINEKIPVLGQLSGLFNDNFFEKCGIDVDGDGEVYQYYHADSMALYDLPESVPVAHSAPLAVSENDVFLDSFVSQFDGADKSFLDDAHYSGDVPALYFTVKGNKVEIFDFRLFAKYRTQIHVIMVFCIYTLYFLSLYKSLPSIIGNVVDVQNAFASNASKSEEE